MTPKVLVLALLCAAHVQGRPGNSPHRNPDRVVNTWNDVGNTDYMNKNFSPNDSGNYNSDINGGHDVIIVGSPPMVNKKVETYQVATNDNTNKIPVHQCTQLIESNKIATVKPVTEERTRKPRVDEFADTFGDAFGDAVKDNVHNVGREVESLFEVGKSIADAAGTILDAKAKLVVSVPRVKAAFFGALG